METVKHLKDFPVIELRRYTIKDGQRERFARYFESWFPEAIQQLGAIVAGAFLERARAYQARDSRVEIIDKKTDVHPGLSLVSFYVRFLLPMMVEVQYFKFDAA